MFLPKLIAVMGAVAAVAVIVPKVAPGLFAYVTQPEARQPADVATPEPAPVAPKPKGSTAVGTLSLDADDSGHFLANARINGRNIQVFVDTGATFLALNEATARQLGITPPRSAFTMPMSTANGISTAAPVRISEVRIGDIAVRDVSAIVVPGKALAVNLLGMSFLSRLSKFEVAGDRLLLVE